VIHDIRNPYLRRAALVLTVFSIVVCVGPLRLVQAVLRWIEDEFEADLADVWRGRQLKGKL
jgi:hypothetical protein